MNNLLPLLHDSMRYVHIVLGFAGLALFWLIISMTKGTRRHVLLGKIFVFIAYVVGGTAVVSGLWAVLHLDSHSPWLTHISDKTARQLREFFPFFYSILTFLGFATIAGAVYGVRLMRFGPQHERLRTSSVPFWVAMCAFSALGLILFGAYRMIVPHPSAALPWPAYQVPFFLGAFGLWGSYQDFRYIYGPVPLPREWFYRHVEQMCGLGVAFHTAFAVFGSRRFGLQLSGALSLLPWLVPVVCGTVATHRYVQRLRRAARTTTAAPPAPQKLGMAAPSGT